jgi:hypothetical protein
MPRMEAILIPTNDLLRHSELRLHVHGNEVAWVQSISGPQRHLTISVGLGNVTIFGQMGAVRERLAALLKVVDSAIAQPDLWPQIGMRRVSERHWTRDAPNPFVALGNGAAGPEMVRPIYDQVGPVELPEPD